MSQRGQHPGDSSWLTAFEAVSLLFVWFGFCRFRAVMVLSKGTFTANDRFSEDSAANLPLQHSLRARLRQMTGFQKILPQTCPYSIP